MKRKVPILSRFSSSDQYDSFIDIINYFYSLGGFSIMIENFSKVESNPFPLEIFARDLRSIYNVFIFNFYSF